MENSRLNRRGFLKGLAAIALGACTPLAYSGESQPKPKEKPILKQEQLEKQIRAYSDLLKQGKDNEAYEEFKRALGNKYDPKQEELLKKYWSGVKESERKVRIPYLPSKYDEEFERKVRIYLRLKDPETYMKKYIKDKNRRERLIKERAGTEDNNDEFLKALYPWKVDLNDLSDRIYLDEFFSAAKAVGESMSVPFKVSPY